MVISSQQFKKYWPANLHLIGKDIIKIPYHLLAYYLDGIRLTSSKTDFWPSMAYYRAAPGDKMSKSKGNVLYADDLVKIFGVDAVRYFVLHEMPFDNDGIITWELLVERINSDLANTLGNL